MLKVNRGKMNKHTTWFFLGLLAILLLSSIVHALPAGPSNINYISNSTAAINSPNRSIDAKGTITVINLDANQQDFKWKAYLGNISGKLALDDATGKSIYDWTMGVPAGEVYVSRYSGIINWPNVSCATVPNVAAEQTALGMASGIVDNINSTFSNIIHKGFAVGTKPISNDTCKSTATYINDTAQVISDAAKWQEVLLQDDITSSIIYTTFIENQKDGYNGGIYNFQMVVAENESATVPTTYFFYVELG